jgi:ArsR family transcriptional regulator, arsenate/arsenite/antimonite-responsive transcriptional repressor
MCQIKEVTNQKLLPVLNATDGGVCCPPLASEPLSAAGAEEMAVLFKAVADPVRLRLLSLIACHPGGESCVCDLTPEFDMTAPSVSYHLKVLREAGLIISERRGTWVYYRVVPQAMARMSAVLELPASQLPARWVAVQAWAPAWTASQGEPSGGV